MWLFLVMPPRFQLSGEIRMGVSDLQVVDDLGASIFLDGDNCQLSQLGVADAISGDDLGSVEPTFAHGEEWVFRGDPHSGDFTRVIFERNPNQINGLARHDGGYGEDAGDASFLVAGDDHVAFAKRFDGRFALGC